ncbi:hypothetical protein FGO68_gene17376 [Halteria grandinella]|uniref:Uncharacterized protein n=1 Tax=Halteria grandinella TaxID=5974 RepID=A0A8J8NCY5_HALGN|nr:hypothetical protein FGO68_gene17376 [Halteria grandinella]
MQQKSKSLFTRYLIKYDWKLCWLITKVGRGGVSNKHLMQNLLESPARHNSFCSRGYFHLLYNFLLLCSVGG